MRPSRALKTLGYAAGAFWATLLACIGILSGLTAFGVTSFRGTGDLGIAAVILFSVIVGETVALLRVEILESDGQYAKEGEVDENFETRIAELEQDVADIEAASESGSKHTHRLTLDVDIAIAQLLTLAVSIVDDPHRSTSSNLMEYDAQANELVLTHTHGLYKRWRFHRTLDLNSKEGQGVAGAAFLTRRILYVDDTSKASMVHWKEAAEKRILKGIVSIPISAGPPEGRILAVLNVDSTTAGLLTEARCRDRATEVQRVASEILGLKAKLFEAATTN